MFLQLLKIPPSDEEKLEFLKENSNCDPAISLIVAPFSDKFKTVSPVINLPPSLRDLYWPGNEELTDRELLAVFEQVTITISDQDIGVIEAATCE